MMLLDELIQMMIGMSDEQLAKIKAFILGKLKLTSEIPNTQILSCPVCGSKHIVKNGKRGNSQQYLCKDCKHQFSTTTNTIAHKSKHSIVHGQIIFRQCLLVCRVVIPQKYAESTIKRHFIGDIKSWEVLLKSSMENCLSMVSLKQMKHSYRFPIKAIIPKVYLLCIGKHIIEAVKPQKEASVKSKYVYLA